MLTDQEIDALIEKANGRSGYMALLKHSDCREFARMVEAAERERMDRLYAVVSRIVENDHTVNITRLHDYTFGVSGVSADAVDGGPVEAVSAVPTESERLRAKVRHHLSMTTMSLYGTQSECKAARDALQRLLDDLA